MSSTNRGATREPSDFYPTPAWCVHRLLEAIEIPGTKWQDPCAGDGAIVRAVSYTGSPMVPVQWSTFEIRPECEAKLVDLVGLERHHTADWLRLNPTVEPDAIITNPPYSLAMEFVQAAIDRCPFVAMLLRLNFLGSESRSQFLRDNPPSVYVLPNRPSFVKNGHTDSIEYAWFVWRDTWDSTRVDEPTIRVLATTPRAERCAPRS